MTLLIISLILFILILVRHIIEPYININTLLITLIIIYISLLAYIATTWHCHCYLLRWDYTWHYCHTLLIYFIITLTITLSSLHINNTLHTYIRIAGRGHCCITWAAFVGPLYLSLIYLLILIDYLDMPHTLLNTHYAIYINTLPLIRDIDIDTHRHWHWHNNNIILHITLIIYYCINTATHYYYIHINNTTSFHYFYITFHIDIHTHILSYQYCNTHNRCHWH